MPRWRPISTRRCRPFCACGRDRTPSCWSRSRVARSGRATPSWARSPPWSSPPRAVDSRCVTPTGASRRCKAANPFDALRTLLARFKPVAVPGLPRFQGGAVGLSLLRHGPPRREAAPPGQGRPQAARRRVHVHGQPARLRQPAPSPAGHRQRPHHARTIRPRSTAPTTRRRSRIEALLDKLARPARPPAPLTFPAVEPLVAMGEEGFTSTMDEATYMERVRQAKEYIASGDAYQIVVSRRLDTELRADPFTVYRALRTHQPVAVSLLPAPGQDEHRRLLARGAGAPRGRPRRGAPHRGHAPAGQGPRRRTRSSRPRCRPTPRSAPST